MLPVVPGPEKIVGMMRHVLLSIRREAIIRAARGTRETVAERLGMSFVVHQD